MGILCLNNGYIYDGNFLAGKKHGRGCLFSDDKKFKFEGNWIDDEKDGYGVENFPDGTKYEGYFEKGKKNGKGELYKMLELKNFLNFQISLLLFFYIFSY